jgi:hypothetical protein
MAAIKKPPPDDPEQSARFVETAKVIEADKSRSAFTRAFRAIVPPKKRAKAKRQRA